MKKEADKKILLVFLRYCFLILIVLPGLSFFYLIFTPLTLYPSYFLFDLVYGAVLQGTDIIVTGFYTLEIVDACVAGSAYFLLLILNLSVPISSIIKRIKMIVLSFLILLFLNIMRIFILGILFINNSPYFDASHEFFWYFLSTGFVVGIWFFEVKIFKIEKIPFLTDLRFFYKKSSFSK